MKDNFWLIEKEVQPSEQERFLQRIKEAEKALLSARSFFAEAPSARAEEAIYNLLAAEKYYNALFAEARDKGYCPPLRLQKRNWLQRMINNRGV